MQRARGKQESIHWLFKHNDKRKQLVVASRFASPLFSLEKI